LEELNRVVEAKEEIENRCRELDLQVLSELIINKLKNLFLLKISTLQDEKLSFIQETAQLNERIQQFENAEDSE
jgi:hypothetical protein